MTATRSTQLMHVSIASMSIDIKFTNSLLQTARSLDFGGERIRITPTLH